MISIRSAARLAAALALAMLPAAGSLAAIGPNPANHHRLIDLPIERLDYDPATKCTEKRRPGMRALLAWLERHTRGESWGTYRCEKWGKGSFSVHSEGRAVDWHLDARVPEERRQAMKLIRRRLLATDREGNENALARRMGVQGIIFDCRAWFSRPGGLGRYDYCFNARGERKPARKLDPTQAHVDHIHIELNKRGARGKTSLWLSGLR